MTTHELAEQSKYVTSAGKFIAKVKHPGNGWLGKTKTGTDFIRLPLLIDDPVLVEAGVHGEEPSGRWFAGGGETVPDVGGKPRVVGSLPQVEVRAHELGSGDRGPCVLEGLLVHGDPEGRVGGRPPSSVGRVDPGWRGELAEVHPSRLPGVDRLDALCAHLLEDG